MTRSPNTVLRCALPVAWMAVIAILSGDVLGSDQTGAWLLPYLSRLLPGVDPSFLDGLHAVTRKMGHVVEYGILAALWRWALATSSRRAAWAIGLSAAYAGLDEARQGLTTTRTSSGVDVLIDSAGAWLAVACLDGRGVLAGRGLRLARWAAVAVAVGSLAAAILDWSLGLAAGDLALAALGAAAGAAGLRRLEARVCRVS